MKQVFDKSTLAHYWANQRQQSGRYRGGNFYFEGRTIYSYGSHFPIATISKKDSNVVLFTTRTYSVTTTGHIYEARAAASHKQFIYCHSPELADNGSHFGNIDSFEATAKSIASHLAKARKPEKYLNEIAQQKEMLMKYVNFFGLKPSTYKHLHYINIVTKDGAVTATEKERKQMEREQKKREAERAKQREAQLVIDKDVLKLWRGFKSFYGPNYGTLRTYSFENTFLRFNKAGNNIQTTKGVEIPVNVAERFYRWLKRTLNNGGCNGECKHEILGYEVQTVDKDHIVIGCHDITWDEINAIAKKLKWK